AHHRVDVVLELGHLTLRVDGDRPGEVAGRDGAGHSGDGADLAGQVPSELVHVLGQPLPGAGDPGHLGLAAQDAVGANLAGDPGDLVGERGQLVDHGV